MYDKNKNGEIVNGDATYAQAVVDLNCRGMVVLNWTDRMGTLLNVLLAYDPTSVGTPGGLFGGGLNKLWVGVVGRGCWPFSASASYLTTDYVAEKLKMQPDPTVRALAELLTGVREAMATLGLTVDAAVDQ